jgi:hypothetical protein
MGGAHFPALSEEPCIRTVAVLASLLDQAKNAPLVIVQGMQLAEARDKQAGYRSVG